MFARLERLRGAVLAAFLGLCFLPGLAQIPVTDRDEARFIQASRQMAQSGDLIDIRFGEALRMKKPVGIYWLQAGSARLFGQGGAAPVWAHRLVSALAAGVAVALTARIGAVLFGAQVAGFGGAAFGGAALLAASLLLASEARIAKTDAALLAAVLGAQLALARLYMARFHDIALPRGLAYGFWLSLAAAVLIKGPIAVLLVALCALALSGKGFAWLAPLGRARPILLALALAAPWFVAITWRYGMGFWQGSVGVDLLPKLAAGQEGKGAPFGTYLALIWVSFWPAAALIPLALRATLSQGLRAPKAAALRFLAAWVIPFWLVLECVPTKLLHYNLPLLPALALWVAAFAPQGLRAGKAGGTLALTLASAAAVIGPALGAGVLVFARKTGVDWAALAPLIAALLAASLLVVALIHALWRGQGGRIVPLAALSGALLWAGLFPTLARSPALWPADQAAARALETLRAAGCAAPQLTGWGFTEPSLLWLGGAQTRLISAQTPFPTDLTAQPCHALIRAETTPPPPAACTRFGHVEGLAIGAGQWVRLDLMRCAERR